MVFVGRETELEKLEYFLQKALNSETQVCFIKGEAGTGKSHLIEEFVAQSASLDDNLLFTRGNCNAQTGISDPYIPFRNILAMLVGDNANPINKSNDKRLIKGLKVSGRVLVDIAPDLIGAFIPGANVLAGLARFGARERGLLKGLEDLEDLKKRAQAAEKSHGDIEQSQIFLQYTALLRNLAEKCPLVIILEDLQWVDTASNALFFHLVRELKQSRILFIGLYRPSDVTAGRNGERHPLEQTLNEIKRLYGDIWIDLDQTTEQDGQAFVNALIDSEPNQLSPSFRKVLFDRTRGHALFTTELLHAMQERRYLRQDPEGNWYEFEQLNWNELPARVEGIIEERIARLSDDMRDILNIACVEGQEFTAQVVAEIQKTTERDLIKKLARQLKQCHHLVQDLEEKKLGAVILSKYTFSHALFQAYLYKVLEEPERRMLHRDVAEALESLYGEQSQTIATQLVRHYTEAMQADKVAEYRKLEGQQFFKLGEFKEARNSFNEALEATNNNTTDTVLERAELIWLISQTHYNTGDYKSAESYYRKSLNIARSLRDDQTIIKALIGLAQCLRRAYDSKNAMNAAQEALSIARNNNNRTQEANAMRVLGIIYGQMNKNDQRLEHYQEALKIANEIGDVAQEMDCLNNIGVVYDSVSGDFPKAIEYYNQALNLGKKYHNLSEQAIYLEGLAMSYRKLGDYGRAKNFTRQHWEMTVKIANTQYGSVAYQNFGIVLLHTDINKIDLAIKCWQKSIKIADAYERIETQVDTRNRLLIAYVMIEQLDEALKLVEETKPLLQKYTTNTQVSNEIFLEAIVYLRKGELDKARRLFQNSIRTADRQLDSERWAYRYHRAFAQAGIVLLAPSTFRSDDFEEARRYFQEAVSTCGWVGILNDALILLQEMQKADPDNILKPIETYLLEKRQIAWNNLPLND